jgi:hypothetical protein
VGLDLERRPFPWILSRAGHDEADGSGFGFGFAISNQTQSIAILGPAIAVLLKKGI